MRTAEQVKQDFVQRWLDKAEKDLAAAEVLLKGDFEDNENVAFHAQQAAEKFIKAFLVRHQIEFPKTHDIALLRHLVAVLDPTLGEKLSPADVFTPYGVEFRYPGEVPPVSLERGTEVFQLASERRKLILEHLKSYLISGRPRHEGS